MFGNLDTHLVGAIVNCQFYIDEDGFAKHAIILPTISFVFGCKASGFYTSEKVEQRVGL